MSSMRQSKWWHSLLLVVLVITFLGACKSSKGVQTHGRHEHSVYDKQQFIRAYGALQDYPIVHARGTVSIFVENERNNAHVRLKDIGMRWYLERGKAYELSVRPFSVMEVGRLTVAEDQVLALDRMNQLYFHMPNVATKLQQMIGVVGVDPRVLEAVVSYTPFNFVEQGASALGRMDFKREESGYLFRDEIRRGKCRLEHHFDRGLNLQSSHLVIEGVAEVMVSYSDYIHVDNTASSYRPLPTSMQIELKLGASDPALYMLHFRLKQVEVDRQKSIDLTPPLGYRQVQWSDLLELIAKL